MAQELGKQNALYLFESLKSKGSRDLHLTSTHFDEPTARKMVSKYDNVLSLHGYSGNEKHIFVGGTDRERAKKLTQLLNQNGFPAELITKGHDEIAGINSGNIANKNRTGKSIQLEISQPLRSAMFHSFTSKGRASSKTQTFYRFTNVLSTFASTSY
ncbi:poly-gamma-glutamate hydrolase family protein [Priestia sp. OVS21]|nr:poly-gamma-glutamate hydrolase family protein [Priestia sp. OVS21]